MDPQHIRTELCWFTATCLALLGFVLVLAAIGVSSEGGWALPGFTLLVLAGVSLVVMAMFMAIAFKLERHARELSEPREAAHS